MQSCQFANSVIEHGSGRFLLQHSLLPFCWLSCSGHIYASTLPQQPMQDIGNIAAQSVHLGDLRLLIRVQNKITAFSLNL